MHNRRPRRCKGRRLWARRSVRRASAPAAHNRADSRRSNRRLRRRDRAGAPARHFADDRACAERTAHRRGRSRLRRRSPAPRRSIDPLLPQIADALPATARSFAASTSENPFPITAAALLPKAHAQSARRLRHFPLRGTANPIAVSRGGLSLLRALSSFQSCLGQHRTIRRCVRLCLFRHLRHADSSGTTAQFGGASGAVFSAICGMQISRFTSSKPSKFAIASDEKSIRRPTTSFVRCCPKTLLRSNIPSRIKP